jgi:hypothetical protein
MAVLLLGGRRRLLAMDVLSIAHPANVFKRS